MATVASHHFPQSSDANLTAESLQRLNRIDPCLFFQAVRDSKRFFQNAIKFRDLHQAGSFSSSEQGEYPGNGRAPRPARPFVEILNPVACDPL
ncbi:hypothetical protein GCM10010990_36320 [Croceicoccus mobilis]|uniref:Uncharacterized protein n=1 Tax=Croceicoccus mobilis TaxID=1703339 RepID=A0A916Z9L3_9SPHN|nr:hypothetical protein GCM10010990_36320 [Croceicoccus mobilis]